MSFEMEHDRQTDRSAQLAKEYEDFVYTVSHDLGAPLRHVREFTKLLIGARSDSLTSEEEVYVGFIEKALQQLDDMQGALLEISRLTTRAEPHLDTDLNETIASILKELDGVYPGCSSTIDCGRLPTVRADAKQVRLLFRHLIDNALKFHEESSADRRVNIRTEDQGDTFLFEVRDNGIGIDEAFHEEVFRPFRRLERERYPGVGVGLTLSQKIVQCHRGRILMDSAVGKGTSVFFTLAKS